MFHPYQIYQNISSALVLICLSDISGIRSDILSTSWLFSLKLYASPRLLLICHQTVEGSWDWRLAGLLIRYLVTQTKNVSLECMSNLNISIWKVPFHASKAEGHCCVTFGENQVILVKLNDVPVFLWGWTTLWDLHEYCNLGFDTLITDN